MTFPASNLMKQTIAAASHFRPRPVKSVVTGTGDHHGPGEGHAADRNGLGEKDNVANRRIGNVRGDRMQEDVFFPLPVQHRHDSDHDHPSTASMPRKFFKENPRAVYMAVNGKDPRSQVLNAGSNATENSSFSASRLVPYSIMKAGRDEAREQKGKNKQSEVVPRAGRDNQSWASKQASSRCHRIDANVFGTRPTDFEASIHPSRATTFVNVYNPLDHFVHHRPELAHDTSCFFPDRRPHALSCHADPDSMDVDTVPFSTPTMSYESRWRRDSLNNDVEMEDSGPVVQQEDVVMGDVQANDHPACQDDDIEMGERTPLFTIYPSQGYTFDTDVHMDDAPITQHREEFHTNLYGEFMDVDIEYTFTQPPAPPVVSNTPPHCSLPSGQEPNTPSPSPPTRQRRKIQRCRGTPPYPKTGIHRDRIRALKSGPAGAHPHFRRSEGRMPLSVEVMFPQPSPPAFAQTTSSSSIHPASALSLPIIPSSAIMMAPHYAGSHSSSLAYPSPPSSQRRRINRYRATPPYPKTGIHRDRTLKSGPAGAHPQFKRSEGRMPLGVEVIFPQPSPLPFAQTMPSSSTHPTSTSSLPIFSSSAITMAPHYAGPPSSSLAYPSPPSSQRRRTIRYRATPPYPKSGIHRDRTLKSGPAGAHPQLRRSQGPMPLGVEVIFPQPSPLPFALATPMSSSIHPTSAPSFSNFPPSAIPMAPHRVEPFIPMAPAPITPTPLPIQFTTSPYVFSNPPSSTTPMTSHPAGLPSSSPAYPFIPSRQHDEAPRTESLAIGPDTPSSPSPPSPSSRRGNIHHRCQDTPPYTPTPSGRAKSGTCQDRALKAGPRILSLASAYSQQECTTSRAKRNALITSAQFRRRLFST